MGDYVAVCPEADNEPFYVAHVSSMWEELGEKHFHATWFNRGSETVLGETGDPSELFLVDNCDDTPLYAVIRRVEVDFHKLPSDWSMLGGVEDGDTEREEDGTHFFYQKWYDADTARFEDIPPECALVNGRRSVECYSCVHKKAKVSNHGDQTAYWRCVVLGID